MRRLALIAPLVLAAAAAEAGPDPGFWLVGWAPGTDKSQVKAISGDGLIAAGSSAANKPYFGPGFTWTRDGGRSDFGLLQGMPAVTTSTCISDNGVVAGEMFETDPAKRRAYRWTGNGPLEDFGVLPGQSRSYAASISGDGQIVVGTCEKSQFSNAYGEAFYWTPQAGMKGLDYLKPNGTFSKAYAISRDGSTIVGMSQSNDIFGDVEAFTWSLVAGMKKLPDLPGALFINSEAYAASVDGSAIVGISPTPGGQIHAVRWLAGDILDLGTTGGNLHSAAYAVNADGTVIAGSTFTGSDHYAFVWTEPMGMLALTDYLAAHGVDVPANYQLTYVYGVSADGMTFVGHALNLDTNVTEGFVATVPAGCYADCDSTGELDVDDFICFQTFFGLGNPAADCDGSGELDIDDFVCFQTAFGVGCP